MFHRFSLGSLFVLMLAGCSDSYEPAKREAAPADSAVTAAPAPTPPPITNPHAALTEAVAAEDLGPEVTVGSIQLKGPDGWTRKQARSQFVAAEFALPKAEGDESDGRLTLSLAGGSVEDNVKRWRGQFGGKPEKDSQQELDIAGLKVTVVDFIGTFADQPGPFAPAVERPGYRMLAAIVPVGDQLHFIKAYGPQKTMADQEDAFHAFLQTLQKK
jgi:hypothetical protein